MARKILRQHDAFSGTVNIADSSTLRRRMPLGTTLARYFCRFTGSFVVGTAALTSVNEDAPYGYLRSIDTVLNSSFPLRGNVSGRGHFFLNRIQYGTPPQFTAPPVGTGTTAIVAEFSIDYGQPDLASPLDAAFWMDSRLLSSLELVWTFGVANSAVASAITDIGVNSGTSTQVLNTPAIVVYGEEVADAGGFLSRMQITRIKQAIAATGNLDVQLPALGPAYRGIAIHYTSGSGNEFQNTSDDTVDTDVSLLADNVVRHLDAAPYRAVRQDNKITYSVETMPAGWEFLDFARSHNLRDLIYTSRTRQLVLRINVGAAPAGAVAEIFPLNALLVVRNPQAPQRVAPVTGAGGRTR
jgi:hypothetical protein